MGWAVNMERMTEDKFIQIFGWETRRKEASWKTES